MRDDSKQNLAHTVYEQLRSELFDFRLLPGDRFSEIEVAERTGASRTPVRQALYRLHSEGFLEVRLWQRLGSAAAEFRATRRSLRIAHLAGTGCYQATGRARRSTIGRCPGSSRSALASPP